jgi:putative SOS response-associated peptidase YedK
MFGRHGTWRQRRTWGVIVNEEAGRVYKNMRWGLIPFWAKDQKTGNPPINARVERIAAKPAFHAAWKQRHCLILASGFYQWRTVPQGLRKKPATPLPLTFAGLWERWGPDKLQSCTILATETSDGIRDLHSCMPAMLSSEGFEPWLASEEPAVDPAIDAAVPVTPVSPKMNSPRYNEPDCIVALAAPA